MQCGFRSLAASGFLLGLFFTATTPTAQCAKRTGAERPKTEQLATAPAPLTRENFARRIFAVTNLVLARHIDPPTRQEMILGGMKSLVAAANKSPMADLSRRISEVTTADQLTALLDDLVPQTAPTSGSADILAEPLREAFIAGFVRHDPGSPRLVSAKEARAEMQMQANRYVGLGIAVEWNDSKQFPEIVNIVPGGPAEIGGMREGDLIEAIDHVPVTRTRNLPYVTSSSGLACNEGSQGDAPSGTCRFERDSHADSRSTTRHAAFGGRGRSQNGFRRIAADQRGADIDYHYGQYGSRASELESTNCAAGKSGQSSSIFGTPQVRVDPKAIMRPFSWRIAFSTENGSESCGPETAFKTSYPVVGICCSARCRSRFLSTNTPPVRQVDRGRVAGRRTGQPEVPAPCPPLWEIRPVATISSQAWSLSRAVTSL